MDLEKIIAENALRFGIKNLSDSDREYISSRALQEQIKPVEFNFEFTEGTYKYNELDNVKIATLYRSLGPICKNIITPKMANIKTTIKLQAYATNVPIKRDSQLYKDGITNNTILAKKRLETLELIILACIRHWIPSITQDMVNTNFTFIKNSAVGDTTSISANVTQTGEVITNLMTCKSGIQKFSGVQGSKSNNYVGYQYDALAAFNAGDSVTLKFDPLFIPDCFWIKMEGVGEILSGFMGDADKAKNIGDNIKYPDLRKTINSKIATLGGTKTLNDLNITPATSQGGKDTFITFIKKPFLDKLKVIVFAPLDSTVFNIEVTCTPGTTSTPLGAPTVQTMQRDEEKQAKKLWQQALDKLIPSLQMYMTRGLITSIDGGKTYKTTLNPTPNQSIDIGGKLYKLDGKTDVTAAIKAAGGFVTQ